MQDNEAINTLQNQLKYSPKNISDIKVFISELLKACLLYTSPSPRD